MYFSMLDLTFPHVLYLSLQYQFKIMKIHHDKLNIRYPIKGKELEITRFRWYIHLIQFSSFF